MKRGAEKRPNEPQTALMRDREREIEI